MDQGQMEKEQKGQDVAMDAVDEESVHRPTQTPVFSQEMFDHARRRRGH
jgi:hypothetical protein